MFLSLHKGWVAGAFYDSTKSAKDGVSRDTAHSLGVAMAVNSTAYEGKDDKGKLVRQHFPFFFAHVDLL